MSYSNKLESSGILGYLASNIGASEPAIRLIISIFLGFPFAYIHRCYLYKKSPNLQHIYFIICGGLVGIWNFGWDFAHLGIALSITYLILLFIGGTNLSVGLIMIFNMSYLLYGYWITATDDYDIKWTMPFCVLTLRLIGLAFNLLDGQKNELKLSEYPKTVCLKQVPSILEVAAFVYFPGSCLVGPQFSLKRYQDFVNGKLIESNALPDCLVPGLKRTLVGFLYLTFYQLGILYVSNQYLLSEEFANEGLIKKMFLIAFWGRVNLYKYICCWLFTEGVCTAFGLSYNGKDEKGRPKWDGCTNVDLLTFENATVFNHYILSFNMNTNHWCAEYIYKRLRFLGSRVASQLFTLVFLAIWHGLHSGYYATFFMEFIIMYFEKDIGPVLQKNGKLQKTINHPIGKIIVWFVLKMYTFVYMGYSIVPFVLLSWPRYSHLLSTIYWNGHIIFCLYPLIAPFLKQLIRQKPHEN